LQYLDSWLKSVVEAAGSNRVVARDFDRAVGNFSTRRRSSLRIFNRSATAVLFNRINRTSTEPRSV